MDKQQLRTAIISKDPMVKAQLLSEIFNDDAFDLLKVKAPSIRTTEEQRIIDNFLAINAFYAENQCEPQKTTQLNERKLANQLAGIRSNPEHIALLVEYDEFCLIGEIPSRAEIEAVEQPTLFKKIIARIKGLWTRK